MTILSEAEAQEWQELCAQMHANIQKTSRLLSGFGNGAYLTTEQCDEMGQQSKEYDAIDQRMKDFQRRRPV
jgi:hypothetical protein